MRYVYLDPSAWVKRYYHELGTELTNQDGTITAQEEAELDMLVAEGQQGTLRKAKALLALKHLGIDMLPALEARVRSSSR